MLLCAMLLFHVETTIYIINFFVLTPIIWSIVSEFFLDFLSLFSFHADFDSEYFDVFIRRVDVDVFSKSAESFVNRTYICYCRFAFVPDVGCVPVKSVVERASFVDFFLRLAPFLGKDLYFFIA